MLDCLDWLLVGDDLAELVSEEVPGELVDCVLEWVDWPLEEDVFTEVDEPLVE